MARKSLVNCLQVLGVTGLSQVTSNVLTASGNSQEFYEFAAADAVRFYLDISAVSGTTPKIVFELDERDPATGVFFPANPASDPIFNATGLTAVTSVPLVSTVDPCYAEAYQVKWTITGTTPSFTCSLLAQVVNRGGS